MWSTMKKHNQQPAGDIWLYKKFKDFNGTIFKGCVDAKEAEDWLREIEKIFKIMRCSDEEKVLLVEFSLKAEAQVWLESMGRVHA